jgi:hypothetical protein
MLTLTDVMESVKDKLEEAEDFLGEMEKTKAVEKLFRHRLSAFLSAAGSVTMFMKEHGTKYAQQINNTTFTPWYNGKQSQFVTPTERNKHKIGTDKTWVYLAVARNKTIHVEPVGLAHLNVWDIRLRLRLRTESEPVSPPPPEAAPQQTNQNLWSFKPLLMEVGGKLYKFDPPGEDVVTVCKDHIKRLEDLIAECEAELR